MLKDLTIIELNAMYQSAEKVHSYYARITEDPMAVNEPYFTEYVKNRIKVFEQLASIRKAIEDKLDDLVGDE